MSTKEILLEVAEKLPPDATLVDGISELEFRQAVEKGLAELDRGVTSTCGANGFWATIVRPFRTFIISRARRNLRLVFGSIRLTAYVTRG